MAYTRKTRVRPTMVVNGAGSVKNGSELALVTVSNALGSFISSLGDEKMGVEVAERSSAFAEARRTAGMGILAMGEHLNRLREILEPLKKWKEYLGLIPNFTQASAYRYIWGWENANRVLPPAVARVATIEGYKLVETKKNGKLAPPIARAFKRVEKKLGPAPVDDEAKAREFLRAVMEEKRKRPVVELTPAWSDERERELQESMLKRFATDLKRVPESHRTVFSGAILVQFTELVESVAGVRKSVARAA